MLKHISLPHGRGSDLPSRRSYLRASLAFAVGGLLSGCTRNVTDRPTGVLEKVWGNEGITQGRLRKPRGLAIDREDRLYIVDMTARIQVFTRDGEFLRGWKTPASENGRPTGLSFNREGNLLVADTHYFRMLVYTPEGKLLTEQTIGGECGPEPGKFHFVTDAVQDSHGNYYISEYGEYDRVQKFTREGKFLFQWGSHGNEPGAFLRPQSIAVDEQDRIWVADACNHRVQLFDASGKEAKLLALWGEQGSELGKLNYPYGLQLDDRGHVYLCEFGNHRVQKFTREGKLVGWWGKNGRREGELVQPWAAQLDSQGSLHILDSYNHRVQRIRL